MVGSADLVVLDQSRDASKRLQGFGYGSRADMREACGAGRGTKSACIGPVLSGEGELRSAFGAEQDRSPHSPPGPSALPNGKSELAIVVVVAEGVIRS